MTDDDIGPLARYDYIGRLTELRLRLMRLRAEWGVTERQRQRREFERVRRSVGQRIRRAREGLGR